MGEYEDAVTTYGSALLRLAGAYEADAEKRRDLLQEIHLQLWRSFEHFDRRCSLRTWVYRVAHHTATSHIIRERRSYSKLVGLDEAEAVAYGGQTDLIVDRRNALERLWQLVHQLKPLDKQVMVSYLEGMDAASIGEITGLSAAHVAMKVHRIKAILGRKFYEGERHGRQVPIE